LAKVNRDAESPVGGHFRDGNKREVGESCYSKGDKACVTQEKSELYGLEALVRVG